MLVPIFLLVVWIIQIDFIKIWDVGNPGAGTVERNIVVAIMMLKQDKRYRQQKIITMIHVVGRKKDL